jgi:hypothetical protein
MLPACSRDSRYAPTIDRFSVKARRAITAARIDQSFFRKNSWENVP